jgi:hypothetical protein
VMLTRTENGLAILAHHRATNHSHSPPYLTDFAVYSDVHSLYPRPLARILI